MQSLLRADLHIRSLHVDIVRYRPWRRLLVRCVSRILICQFFIHRFSDGRRPG